MGAVVGKSIEDDGPSGHRFDRSKRNKEIEQQIEQDRLASAEVVTILLLGGSESGKSTIFKQMRILHMNGFTDTDVIHYRYLINSNIIQALLQLMQGCQQLGIGTYSISEKDMGTFARFVESETSGNYIIDLETAVVIDRIWKSAAIQQCFKRRNEIELLDSAGYFLNEVLRISDVQYRPTEQDILRSRVATTGINVINFIYRFANLRMVDVGGQRSERKKWIHVFDNVNAVLYIVALSSYDQNSEEDPSLKGLLHCLLLFKALVCNEIFIKTAFILFLNKIDIFKEKITKFPLQLCYPDYTGKNTFEEASEYIKCEFTKVSPHGKNLYSHLTEATDTKNVDKVFDSCMDVVLKENISASGLQ